MQAQLINNLITIYSIQIIKNDHQSIQKFMWKN